MDTAVAKVVDGKEGAGDKHGNDLQADEESPQKSTKDKKKRRSKKKDNDLNEPDGSGEERQILAGANNVAPNFDPKPRTSDGDSGNADE